MKKYLSRFGIALLTFGIGVILVSSWFINFFLYKPLGIDEAKIASIQLQKNKENKENQTLSFQQTGSIACGWDSFKNQASWTSYTASDGMQIYSELIYDLKSEKSARKRFNQEIKKAAKILEISPYLDYWKRQMGEKAIVESDGKFSMIKYFKVSSEYSGETFSVTVLESSSLKHLTIFDEQRESLARSFIVNKLKP
jgi:hypothetical protein